MDTNLRNLERDLAVGNIEPQQLWSAQCRANGHQWKVQHGFSRQWLYVLACHNCLATRGKRLDGITLPEIFTITDETGKSHAIMHVVNNLTKPMAVCYKKLSPIRAKYHSHKMRLEVKAILENCFKPVTCDKCKTGLKIWHSRISNVGPSVYTKFFGPLAFAIAKNNIDVIPEGLL